MSVNFLPSHSFHLKRPRREQRCPTSPAFFRLPAFYLTRNDMHHRDVWREGLRAGAEVHCHETLRRAEARVVRLRRGKRINVSTPSQ